MDSRHLPRQRPPVLFPFGNKPVAIFSPGGEPFGATLRLAIEAIRQMPVEDAQARRLMAIIVDAMTAENAIRTFRDAISVIEPGSWIEHEFIRRLENLGFIFATAEKDWQKGSIFVTIRCGKRRVTFVHPHRHEPIRPGERVIVPASPHGRRIGHKDHHGNAVRLHRLHPMRPWRSPHST